MIAEAAAPAHRPAGGGGPTIVIGTAGHIDHGKTALLRALTGIDADRLPEERARGMTIDVGYAHLALEDGVELDFVDVPGHERLIGNMLVGAGEIDAALLVVAADDGPRPQTLEHLALLDALAIRDAVIAVTKVDLVDADRAAAVGDEVRALLRGTWLEAAPVLAVSSVTGEGIAALRAALRDVRDAALLGLRTAPARPARLAVDRVFTARGRGVVVTGTLRGGTLHRGIALRREPGGEEVRVRELQVHGQPRERSDGGRTALNVVGLPAADLRRGDVLTVGQGVRGAERLLVGRTPAPPLGSTRPWPPRGGSRLRLHVGTDQVDVAVRVVRDAGGGVLLDAERPVATFAGDRGVLREPARGEVIGGVTVLDPAPPRGVSRRRVTRERVDALARAVESGDATGVEAARIDLHGVLASEPGRATQAGVRDIAFAEDVASALRSAAVEIVEAHHRDVPLSAGLPLARARLALMRRLRGLATVERRDAEAAAAAISRLLDGLVRAGRLGRSGDTLHVPSRGSELPAALVQAMDRLERALDVPAPPSLAAAAAGAGCPADGVRALKASGRIIAIEPDLAWSAAEYRRLAAMALEMARAAPLTPAAFRDATGTSRRYVLAILEDLDRRGILHRTPEGHIPGPRAPRTAASP